MGKIYNRHATFFLKHVWLCKRNTNMQIVVGLMKISFIIHTYTFPIMGEYYWVMRNFSLIWKKETCLKLPNTNFHTVNHFTSYNFSECYSFQNKRLISGWVREIHYMDSYICSLLMYLLFFSKNNIWFPGVIFKFKDLHVESFQTNSIIFNDLGKYKSLWPLSYPS